MFKLIRKKTAHGNINFEASGSYVLGVGEEVIKTTTTGSNRSIARTRCDYDKIDDKISRSKLKFKTFK
jgi:hypothetical protein